MDAKKVSDIKPRGVTEEQATTKRDDANWAKQVSRLKVGEVSAEALNLNVEGRRLTSPIHGFGKLWQKTYKVALDGVEVSPEEVIKTWKEKFPAFWPKGNSFYGPLTGIAPGEVAVINMALPGKMKLSTGVLVLYADDESFTLMTPEGHMLAGWITFSAFRGANGGTVAQAQVLIRASDPVFELGLTFGGHRKEDRFWQQTLTSLAQHFGVDGPEVATKVLCVEKRRQWAKARNIYHNSAIRSSMYMMTHPFSGRKRKKSQAG